MRKPPISQKPNKSKQAVCIFIHYKHENGIITANVTFGASPKFISIQCTQDIMASLFIQCHCMCKTIPFYQGILPCDLNVCNINYDDVCMHLRTLGMFQHSIIESLLFICHCRQRLGYRAQLSQLDIACLVTHAYRAYQCNLHY